MVKEDKKMIKAVDFLFLDKEKTKETETSLEKAGFSPEDFMQIDEGEALVIKIFGCMPDYTDKTIDAIWEEVFNANPSNIYEYCLAKGVDVLDKKGSPVLPWRDIAVVLKAKERGIIE